MGKLMFLIPYSSFPILIFTSNPPSIKNIPSKFRVFGYQIKIGTNIF